MLKKIKTSIMVLLCSILSAQGQDNSVAFQLRLDTYSTH